MRLTAFATNTTDVPIAALELRHCQRTGRVICPTPAGS
jgi:hypothetical protein